MNAVISAYPFISCSYKIKAYFFPWEKSSQSHWILPHFPGQGHRFAQRLKVEEKQTPDKYYNDRVNVCPTHLSHTTFHSSGQLSVNDGRPSLKDKGGLFSYCLLLNQKFSKVLTIWLMQWTNPHNVRRYKGRKYLISFVHTQKIS